MKETKFKLEKIELSDFDVRSGIGTLKISFFKNQVKDLLVKQYDLREYPVTVSKILTDIKKKDSIIVENDEDDILGSLFVIRFENEDEIEEKLLSFFAKVSDKMKFMKKTQDARTYMKLYNELKTTKLEV